MRKGLALKLIYFSILTTAIITLSSARWDEKPQTNQEALKFPPTMAGAKAQSFFEAFQKTDREGLEKFFRQSLPEEKLKEITAEERARRILGLRQQLGGEIRAVKVIAPAPEEISIILSNAQNDLFRLTLGFEHHGQELMLRMLTVNEAGPEDLAPPPPAMSLDRAIHGFEREIEKAVSEHRYSGVVLISKDFQPIFFKSYGFASKEFAVPNERDTRFNLGSINKIFTKIAVGQLVEKGKLGLDDKLGKFLPDYPNAEAREKVTVRHLVNMSSGIGDFFGPEFQKTAKDYIRHNRDYLKLFADEPLAFEPGSRQMYSNGGYVVLGEIISAASGMDYYDYVRRNIFEPAGMKDSDWFEADAVVENVAEGYTRQNEAEHSETRAPDKKQNAAPAKVPAQKQADLIKKTAPANQQNYGQVQKAWRRNIYTRPARGSAAGGGYASAEDLLRFIRALYESRLMGEAWTNWLFTGIEPVPNRLALRDEKDIPVGHSGHKSENRLILRSTPSVRQAEKNFSSGDIEENEEESKEDKEGAASAHLSTSFTKKAVTGPALNPMTPEPDNFKTPHNPEAEVYGQVEPSGKKATDRSRWSLSIAGGAPGINAVLEFDGQTGYTIIVVANYDPPAAVQVARMIRRYLSAIKQ